METSVPSGGDPYQGLLLDGQFRLDEQVGLGSMARVYRARHLPLARNIAVKLLRRELLTHTEIVTRFKREARIAARLEHPNVVVVHATGEVPPENLAVGGEPFVVLELLEGPSLAAVLDRTGGRLPIERALHIALALCDAVGEAHAQDIVHRDIKPENVMLVRRGGDADFVKLLDFGLAKTLEEQAEWRTRAGAVLGTPRYVSPEGAEGGAISKASDCYSIATLLYECLAGKTPFDGENAVAILIQQVSATPPDLRSQDPARDVPEAIAGVVMQNLAKKPEARAPDARALGRSLVTAARSAGIDLEQIGLSPTLLGATRRSVAAPARTSSDTAPSEREAPLATPRPLRKTAKSEGWLTHRLTLFVACFMLGVAAALGIASGFGVLQGALE